ncbi:MAG: hypothetical protein ACRBCS_03215 [Cellvibrionaceae bacterium]
MSTYDIYVRNGGVAKLVDPRANVGGVAKQVMKGYQRAGGTTKKFYQRLEFVMPDHARSYTGPSYTISFGSYTLKESEFVTYTEQGFVSGTGGTGGPGISWLSPILDSRNGDDFSIMDAYEMRLVTISGMPPNSGSSAGTWYSLYSTTTPRYYWTGTISNTPVFRGRFEWRRVSTGAILHTSLLSLN